MGQEELWKKMTIFLLGILTRRGGARTSVCVWEIEFLARAGSKVPPTGLGVQIGCVWRQQWARQVMAVAWDNLKNFFGEPIWVCRAAAWRNDMFGSADFFGCG